MRSRGRPTVHQLAVSTTRKNKRYSGVLNSTRHCPQWRLNWGARAAANRALNFRAPLEFMWL